MARDSDTRTLVPLSASSSQFQVGLVAGVVVAYVVMGILDLPPLVILVVAATGALLILLHQFLVVRIRAVDLGFRLDNLRRAVPPAAAATVAFAAVAVAWALATDRPLWSPDLAWMLLLYPLWGLAQQAIFQGILHRNLRALAPAPVAALVTTAAFALVHWGRIELVGLTAAAGLVWTILYARCPNVIPLGISHGIAAALAYPLILDHAPLG